MNTSLSIYTAYFLVSLGMTIWVARTLHKNGRLFLVEAFSGNQALADSVNHLLLVGFYLINLGFILLFLRIGAKPAGMTFDQMEYEFDARGRITAERAVGEEFFPADDVILAIGQENAFPWIERDIGIEFDKWGMPVLDAATLQSTLARVFFGGDAAFGPKNIIWAVAHGHQAADLGRTGGRQVVGLDDGRDQGVAHHVDLGELGKAGDLRAAQAPRQGGGRHVERHRRHGRGHAGRRHRAGRHRPAHALRAPRDSRGDACLFP